MNKMRKLILLSLLIFSTSAKQQQPSVFVTLPASTYGYISTKKETATDTTIENTKCTEEDFWGEDFFGLPPNGANIDFFLFDNCGVVLSHEYLRNYGWIGPDKHDKDLLYLLYSRKDSI